METLKEEIQQEEKVKEKNNNANKQALIEEIKTNEEFAKIRRTASDSIAVDGIVRCQGLMGKSNKNALGKIAGYSVKNISDAPITLITEEYEGEGPGFYTSKTANVTLNPGESTYLSPTFMSKNFCLPQYGYHLANGKINADSEKGDWEEVLKSTKFYFKASSGQSITDKELNVFADKKSKGTNSFELKKEFVKTFGYLANMAVTMTKKKSINDKEAQAFYIYTKAKEAGLIPAEM